MSKLKIDEAAGTFEIHRAEVVAFRRYLKTQGIECDPVLIEGGVAWTEAPGEGIQQSDRVSLRPLHREGLYEVEELYRSWAGGGEGV